MQTEDYCPGSTDFKMIREKKGAFEGVEEEINITGFVSCGGRERRLCFGQKNLGSVARIRLYLHLHTKGKSYWIPSKSHTIEESILIWSPESRNLAIFLLIADKKASICKIIYFMENI